MLDPAVVDLIIGGFMGLTILGVTEVVKKFFYKPPKVVPQIAGYVISFIVSAGFTAFYLLKTHTFSLLLFLGYTAYVWAVANGIFKGLHTPTK